MLRFKAEDGSEFSIWEAKKVYDIFSKVKEKNSDGQITNVITNSAELGLVGQREFFDKDIAVEGKTENYTIIKKGDFVYNPRKSKQAPYGPFNCYRLSDVGIVSPLYTCLRPRCLDYTNYLLLYFQSSAWHRYIYNNGAQGGARHDRVGMTDDLMMGIPVKLPSFPEQQKIASFFSDLDEVISASKAEVAALEKQKKGVMQKIFFQEVRFKKDAGNDYPDWEEKKFGDICKTYSGGTPKSGEPLYYMRVLSESRSP